jgi:hypothetical protein
VTTVSPNIPTANNDADIANINQRIYALMADLNTRAATALDNELDTLRLEQLHGPVEAPPRAQAVDVVLGDDVLWESLPVALDVQALSLAGVWIEFVRVANLIDPPISPALAAATHAAVRTLPTPRGGPTAGAVLARSAARAFVEFLETQRAVAVDPVKGTLRTPQEITIGLLQWAAPGGAFDKLRSAIGLLVATYDTGTDPDWAFNDAVRRMLAQLDHAGAVAGTRPEDAALH